MAFPTVNRRAKSVSSTTNATAFTPAWTWTTNTAVPASQTTRWYAFIVADGNPTLTTASSGWAKRGQTSDATVAVTVALFVNETSAAFAASAAPALQIDSTASEQYSASLFAVTAASGKALGDLLATSAQGSSTNSDPPAITNNTGASQDIEVLVHRGGDSTTVATVAPTNYSNLQSQAGGGTNGASSNSADRAVTVASAASENPGTFTSATEQWVADTVGVYEVTSTPGNASAAGVTATSSAPSASAVGNASGSPAGITATASAPSTGATGNALASAAGVTVTASASTATAGVGASASAAGVTASATAPVANATGNATGSTTVATVGASAPAVQATGSALAVAAGATTTANAPASAASAGATVVVAGVTATASAPTASASTGTNGNASAGGVAVTAGPPQAAALGSATASAAGPGVSVTAASATASGAAQADAEGIAAVASPPTAVAITVSPQINPDLTFRGIESDSRFFTQGVATFKDKYATSRRFFRRGS